MPAERMASITKRLPITVADFKDRIEVEKRSNERANATYKAMREARDTHEKLKVEKAATKKPPAKKRK